MTQRMIIHYSNWSIASSVFLMDMIVRRGERFIILIPPKNTESNRCEQIPPEIPTLQSRSSVSRGSPAWISTWEIRDRQFYSCCRFEKRYSGNTEVSNKHFRIKTESGICVVEIRDPEILALDRSVLTEYSMRISRDPSSDPHLRSEPGGSNFEDGSARLRMWVFFNK